MILDSTSISPRSGGRWFSDKAEVQIDDSNNNLLRSSSATSTEYYDTCIVRRGFRAGKYVATFRFKWAPGPSPGFLVRWVNPGDWLAVMVKAADSKAWVYKRVNDGILQSRVPCRRPLRRRVDYVVHGCAKGRGFQVMPARWPRFCIYPAWRVVCRWVSRM